MGDFFFTALGAVVAYHFFHDCGAGRWGFWDSAHSAETEENPAAVPGVLDFCRIWQVLALYLAVKLENRNPGGEQERRQTFMSLACGRTGASALSGTFCKIPGTWAYLLLGALAVVLVLLYRKKEAAFLFSMVPLVLFLTVFNPFLMNRIIVKWILN